MFIFTNGLRLLTNIVRTTTRREEEEEKLALFMKRIINFQQMIRCKEVLLRKDWRIINLLRVAGLQEDKTTNSCIPLLMEASICKHKTHQATTA